MIPIYEINKNRRAKFERLLSEYVNNSINVSEALERSNIYKNLYGIAEQYLIHAKRDIMSCEGKDIIADRLNAHVSFLLDFNKNYGHVSKCINSVKKGRFKQECRKEKENYFGHNLEIAVTELGYTINFPDENVKLFCTKKIINDIQFNI